MYKPSSHQYPGIATVDFCINLVLVFAVLLKLSVAAINAKAVVDVKASPPNATLYIIKVQWAGTSQSDVDTYVGDPIGGLVYFRRLSEHFMVLDHDDTGMDSNTVTLPSGEVVKSELNSETVEIRGLIPGEYTANVMLYSLRGEDGPVKTAVTLYKVAGGDDIKVHDETVLLKKRGDEQTAFRFTLNKAGDVLDINRMQKRFVGVPGGPI
jgi:hypothetical protein